jgi:lipopolysaccharide export system protein LptA
MSFKSLIQIVILLLIPIIIGAVYFKYFDEKKKVVEEIKLSEGIENKKLLDLEKKILELELKNNNLSKKLQTKINEKITVEETNALESEKKTNSDKRDTIFITSDYAEYNISNLNSKFYKNVIINYQDKKISCANFDINMSTNKAIAYNDVIITDPKSTMKAGIVEFDLKTKDININPESINTKIEVISN